VFGLVFVVAGMAFKLGAVPFHMWVPDVYQGSPTAVTLLLGGAPKLAAFAMVIRILVEGLLADGAFDWQQMLLVLAVLSLAVGNLTAIAQTNIKRMLAYSTIAQMGFVLLGMMAGVVGDAAACGPGLQRRDVLHDHLRADHPGQLRPDHDAGAFGLRSRESPTSRAWAKRSPWFAVVMTILMFSLAGVPPMMGFMAKWAVLQAVASTGQYWLAIVAVLFSLIGAFYYLRVVKTIWFDDAADVQPIATPIDMRVALSLNGVPVVLLGLMPGSLLAVCLQRHDPDPGS
jgi:NADH-quinone oxidoreductase subunit N